MVANGPSCTPVAESNEDGIDVHIDVLDESAHRELFKHHIVLIDIIDARALHEFKDSFHNVNRSDLTETNCNGVRHRFLLEVEIREALERLSPGISDMGTITAVTGMRKCCWPNLKPWNS